MNRVFLRGGRDCALPLEYRGDIEVHIGSGVSRRMKMSLCSSKRKRKRLHLQRCLYLQEVTHVTSGLLAAQMNGEQVGQSPHGARGHGAR